MKTTTFLVAASALSFLTLSCTEQKPAVPELDASAFVHVEGPDLIQPNGEKLFIVGTNLGNWLNPEGYMFNFRKCNSYYMINEMFSQLVGPEATAQFWRNFKDRYITRKDIEFIAQTGANTIRLPFHYKLFTDQDYMGLYSEQDGFALIDSVADWCKANNLYLILDMHDCPGGQTGDNIDDSYGYPWLMESEADQVLFCDIWKRIAEHYNQNPIIIGYELMNEPIAHYFENKEELNSKLEPLYKKAVAAIREVDPYHVILLGGPQWNSNFEPFTDWTFDSNIMYTCHRYGGPATKEAIQSYIDFRDKTNLPMYMGELGHNTMEWQSDFARVLTENNIGYTFWPYKKVDESCFNGFKAPEGWNKIIDFSESDRDTYAGIRENRFDQHEALDLMNALLDSCCFDHCLPQNEYIKSVGLKAE